MYGEKTVFLTFLSSFNLPPGPWVASYASTTLKARRQSVALNPSLDRQWLPGIRCNVPTRAEMHAYSLIASARVSMLVSPV